MQQPVNNLAPAKMAKNSRPIIWIFPFDFRELIRKFDANTSCLKTNAFL